MKTKIYVIPGNPIPLARARVGEHRVYDSQRPLKITAGIAIASQHDDLDHITGPLHLDVTFYLPIPKTSEKRAKSLLSAYHIFRPDLSNLLKFVEDAATGILYKDDCTIASVCATKRYDTTPRTEFFLTQL